MRKLVVINVDDLGLHPAISRFVRSGIERRAISSTSVLANGPYFNEVQAMNDAREFAEIGLGAHLNILRGRPLSPAGDVATLITANGDFVGGFAGFFLRLSTGYAKTQEIEREWSRQIERLLESGLKLTHLDSEQHTHCLPGLMPIMVRLACRYGVPWVRRPVEVAYARGSPTGQLKARLLRWWVSMADPLPKKISSAELVWGIIDQGKGFASGRLASYLRMHSNAKVIEVICHPGLPKPSDPAIPASYGHLRVPRYWEFEARTILSDDWAHALSESGFSQVHFGEIEADYAAQN